ncbi:PREDICTED: BRISC complex subunit FAM175B-like [Habropoda laboriosa]|uniref:BRISC complex subunit FAM175B-like n=1 Tax=Habropoda laboriosa TaxID=597456 RepID=UPI00083D88F5|nr:PREDICTED: BRISC complex subunit FAM175B-like [Habropoda laboriosa]
MADSDFLITISGPALSLLFYENVRSRGDQMGFLLGETLEFIVKTYTDADNQVETVKIYNNIEAIVTCPLPDSLYNSIGKINKEKLKDFLHDKSKQVIGWFCFRRNIGLVPTFRDKILHREFASYFSNDNGSKEEFFVTCLLNSSTSSEGGTHKFKHVFLRQKMGTFEPVPLRINNLGSNSFIHEGSDYKPTPTKKSSDVPDVFTNLVESLNLDLTRASGFESAIAIQKAAEQHLSQLIPELCKSDLEVAELEKQIKEFKLNRKAKINGNLNNLNQQYEIEKNEISKERQKSEKISPSRTEPSGDTNQERRVSQPIITRSKPQNTATFVEKNINQSNSRRTNTDAINSPSQEPSAVNSVAEIKLDVTESVSNKSRRFSNMDSEIVKESICKGETNTSGVGRGKGKVVHNLQTELKKGRRTSGPLTTRSSSVRTSHTQVPQQESSEANSVQNTSFQVSYSQVPKKKVDNARKSTDTTQNH